MKSLIRTSGNRSESSNSNQNKLISGHCSGFSKQLFPLVRRVNVFSRLLLFCCVSTTYSLRPTTQIIAKTRILFRSMSISTMQTPIRVKDEPALTSRLPLSELPWMDLQIPPHELRPMNTLTMGQCFNWKKVSLLPNDDQAQGYWTGVLFARPLLVRQLPATTEVACLVPLSKTESDDLRERLLDYFQVKQSLLPLYSQWGERCPRMKVIASCLPGVRVVRQDPWECLVSFICSSNNNIARITLMLDRLRAKYGSYLCTMSLEKNNSTGQFDLCVSRQDAVSCQQHCAMLKSPAAMRDEALLLSKQAAQTTTAKRKLVVKEEDEEEQNNSAAEEEPSSALSSSQHEFHYYTFPNPVDLLNVSEEELRALGMGYRAKFIRESARIVASKSGETWFEQLRAANFTNEELLTIRKQAKKQPNEAFDTRLGVQCCLLELSGVGRKVADCVALFSLDQIESIPVDTHVWDIAVRDYEPALQDRKSLTPAVYEEVGDVFRKLFTTHAGWAHSVLFAAELPGFRELLPEDVQRDMKEFATQQKKLREEAKKIKKLKVELDSKNVSVKVENVKVKTEKSNKPSATSKKAKT